MYDGAQQELGFIHIPFYVISSEWQTEGLTYSLDSNSVTYELEYSDENPAVIDFTYFKEIPPYEELCHKVIVFIFKDMRGV